MSISTHRAFSVTLAAAILAGCAAAPKQTVAVVVPAPTATVVTRARPNVSGNWLSAVPQTDGTVRRTYFTLSQQGDQITGTVHAPTAFVQIIESAWDSTGTGFTITSVTRNGQNERRTTWQGKLVGDSLHMTMQRRVPPNAPPAAAANFRPIELVAHRVPAGEGALPAKIALPARHPVKDNGIAHTPAMGWNSWNKFAGRVDDASVRAMADAMVSSGMKAAGYTYINIDDTWEGDARDAQGNITTNNKFPNMKALADYVHSKGLKIGIYSSPGPVTCAGYIGSYGHEAQDAKTYAGWGIDYLKYDWCGASMLHPLEDEPALYQLMGDALQATGRDIVYSLCQYGQLDVWKWGAEVGGNSWRTTGDIRDAWQSMANIGFRQDVIAQYAKPGHFNDPDMLEIGNGGMTDTEYRTHMSLWSMLASPLLAGNDLRTMTPAIHDILTNREVIAIDQDSLGVQATRVWASDDSASVRKEIWTRPLMRGGNAVAVFNRGPDSAQVTVDFAKLGIDLRRKTVRDLWDHKNVKAKGTQFVASVPSHGVVMMRVGR